MLIPFLASHNFKEKLFNCHITRFEIKMFCCCCFWCCCRIIGSQKLCVGWANLCVRGLLPNFSEKNNSTFYSRLFVNTSPMKAILIRMSVQEMPCMSLARLVSYCKMRQFICHRLIAPSFSFLGAITF